MSRVLDWLFPWRVVRRDLAAARRDVERANRALEILIAALDP